MWNDCEGVPTFGVNETSDGVTIRVRLHAGQSDAENGSCGGGAPIYGSMG
jgi:hypothetical protein